MNGKTNAVVRVIARLLLKTKNTVNITPPKMGGELIDLVWLFTIYRIIINLVVISFFIIFLMNRE